MKKSFFKVLHQSEKACLPAGRSKARLGLINTAHGKVLTPAFVAVATKGTIKAMTPNLVKEVGTQTAFVNTFHLVNHPGADVVKLAGGIHKFSRLDLLLMSDSGGFQVFSLSAGQEALVIKISEDGVRFRSLYDGKLLEFTPEKSIDYQLQIGADIMMAFDECAPYPSDHDYTKKAMERTNQWLLRCMAEFKRQQGKGKSNKNRYLFGIIQGGTYEDLRKESAQFVTSQETDGVAIGGVAVGEPKETMRQEVQWVAPYLPEDRPVHLLGVGQFDDILDLVPYGIDTFDCVEPTRMARMGKLYYLPDRKKGLDGYRQWQEIDIFKSVYKKDLSPIDKGCCCYTCQNFTRAYLHHLFKQKEILGYILATFHNLWVMERFFELLRENIDSGKL
jgi:queuine tRNA-ribosyltransferase